ncbi:carbohydrate ABC transporter permease (plasmid) [Deinococcus sp. KNUC1210]|uniref:carbohydrate ABC transporter permease n=1 Tax=Deinococcus sp. KNUC1210 TaxID=2917691 RepID=UPI001EF095DF|nr:carbohydrate ABC transporter permease [Deinococcus sp. KNUC1210]ULH13826.1 carbohydrate ABC transporter permease [Deinococcus sp. KNUC1210]ULH14195.1 carbohydrate ABC transporter permease [Deinococcus sp. KNUC1210]
MTTVGTTNSQAPVTTANTPKKTSGQAGKIFLTLLTYVLAFIFFFPVLWMLMTAFKTEAQAAAIPPVFAFSPILHNFSVALQTYGPALANSLIAALGSTLLAFLLGLPAAFALAVYPTKRAQGVLSWILSTKFMPAVGVIVPLYLLFSRVHLLDTLPGLIIMYTTMNLPLVIWMMHSYMTEIPFAIFEAAKVDGAPIWWEFLGMALPLSLPGVSATALLAIIFAWNESFFALNLTTSNATPLSIFVKSFQAGESQFWAQISAAAVLTVFPVMLFGWIAQRQLVRGLSFGAVK